MPYIVGRKPNAPAGVLRSPSRLCSETPRCPSQAGQAPATGTQQPFALRQRRSEPCVEAMRAATTVTSCVAAPVESSSLARVGGHELPARSPPAADAARQRGTQQASAIHLIARADYASMRLLLLAAIVLQPPFAHSVSRVTAAQLPYSWHRGCPVAPAQLRRVRLSYWGLDARAHTGTLIVNVSAVGDVVRVFRRLYTARFPIRRMRPIDAYRGVDERSLAANNTAGFNCRYEVA